MVNGARLSNCPTALRLYGPTGLVQLFEVTGFVGRVRRSRHPAKRGRHMQNGLAMRLRRAPYAKQDCREAQAPCWRALFYASRQGLSQSAAQEPLLGTGKHHQITHQNQHQPDNRVAVPDVAFVKR